MAGPGGDVGRGGAATGAREAAALDDMSQIADLVAQRQAEKDQLCASITDELGGVHTVLLETQQELENTQRLRQQPLGPGGLARLAFNLDKFAALLRAAAWRAVEVDLPPLLLLVTPHRSTVAMVEHHELSPHETQNRHDYGERGDS